MGNKRNSPLIVNWLITRKCNLNCNFCGIIRQPKDRNIYDIRQKIANELRLSDMQKIVDFLNKFEPKPFVILYGGEPTLHPDIEHLVDYLNEKDMPYTIITNGTSNFVRSKIETLIKQHKLKGLSMSLDPLVFDPTLKDLDPHRYQKAKSALDLLTYYKTQYPQLDVVAEITVDNKNVHYLEILLQYLTENDIYASITTIERPKTVDYDFASKSAEDLLIKPGTESFNIFRDLIERIVSGQVGYKVHFPEILTLLVESLPDKYRCNLDASNLTIDSDGEIRLCLRIHGRNNINIIPLTSLEPQEAISYIQKFMSDNKHLCKGCAWTCAMMTDLASRNKEFYSRITHMEEV